MATDSNYDFDDDIPEYVRSVSDGDKVEYCGEYYTQGKLWDVYSLSSRVDKLIVKQLGLYPLTGYPIIYTVKV